MSSAAHTLWSFGSPPLRRRLCTQIAEEVARVKLPISPIVGEMSGRTEGGVTERCRPSPAAKTALSQVTSWQAIELPLGSRAIAGMQGGDRQFHVSRLLGDLCTIVSLSVAKGRRQLTPASADATSPHALQKIDAIADLVPHFRTTGIAALRSEGGVTVAVNQAKQPDGGTI
jgi:hypothetical protein